MREENAAAALEVMSRFAIDPRWLLYLPPTMSPVATSPRPDLLEHPEQAFEYYRAEGVDQVVCEEKHMGSRAVALVCRTPADASARFGIPGEQPGVVWSRTGRAFFSGQLTAQVADQLRAAAEKAGLFDELSTSWLLLDAELMPWSAKAEQLLRDQYAAVGSGRPRGAAGCRRGARPSGPGGPGRQRPARAHPGTGGATPRRSPTHTAATAGRPTAWRESASRPSSCWPPRGQHITSGRTPGTWTSPTGWPAADPEHLAVTRRISVATTDPDSVAAGSAWWSELTADGGEGMVVKPAGNLTRGRKGLVQPGLKVRGREYLRIIYGPDYAEPANLERLRARGLGHKRSLALREYALGLEALDRVARGEPLWRVHQCVFAVLALESEPVDPRL